MNIWHLDNLAQIITCGLPFNIAITHMEDNPMKSTAIINLITQDIYMAGFIKPYQFKVIMSCLTNEKSSPPRPPPPAFLSLCTLRNFFSETDLLEKMSSVCYKMRVREQSRLWVTILSLSLFLTRIHTHTIPLSFSPSYFSHTTLFPSLFPSLFLSLALSFFLSLSLRKLTTKISWT